jgi:osmotically-inducible protein OsmY
LSNRDKKISNNIKNDLDHDMDEAFRDVNISVQDGLVHLSGVVDAMNDKLTAEKIVSETSGVRRVENDITISAGANFNDRDSEEIVNKRLRNSIYHNDLSGISATVKGGTAMLNGKAESQDLRKKAMEEASKVPGIRNVVNNITLSTGNDDISLQNEINRLFITSYIDTQDVLPDVNDGVVILNGYVNNQEEASNLTKIAEEIPGIKKVISHLQNRNWSLE